MLFVEQILTPWLTIQFFHADSGHSPLHISAVKQQFYACLIWNNKPRYFHAGVALSWFKSQANPYKSVIISDQTSEYLYFINLGLVRETNPWLRNTTNVSLTFLFTYCRTCSHMCRLQFSQWAIWISFTSDCFRIRFQLAISLNSSDLKKALGRGDHNFNKLPCLICATHHRSHT